MPLTLNLTARIHDVEAVVLENDWLRASVLPGVGAKIYDLIWKAAGRNLLWHNPRILPQAYPVDGNFDNYWCGGWDDGFPTCDPCDYRGESYPGLGELRSRHGYEPGSGHRRQDCLRALRHRLGSRVVWRRKYRKRRGVPCEVPTPAVSLSVDVARVWRLARLPPHYHRTLDQLSQQTCKSRSAEDPSDARAGG